MKIENFKLKIFLVLSLLFLFCPHQVLAQSLSLSISPPILEVFIKPGKSITQTYKIVNNGDPVIVIPRIAQLSETGIKEDEKFIPDAWISLLNTDIAFEKPFLLPKRTSRQIILRVNPPKNLEEKDYLRALVFSTRPNPVGETSQSSLSQNLASPLLITVTSTGLLAKGAQIVEFDLPQLIDSFGPVEADIKVKNTGKTYFHPNGKITLKGPIGKGEYPLLPKIIFAGQTKKIFAEESASKKNQKTLSFSGFFIGKYEVEVDFVLDQGSKTVFQKKTFYALPYKTSVGVLVILIGFYMIRKVKSRKKKKQ